MELKETSKQFWDKVRERIAAGRNRMPKRRVRVKGFKALVKEPDVVELIARPLVGLSTPVAPAIPKKREAPHEKNKRKLLMEKQNGCCAYCHEPFTAERIATYDHVKPKSKGGTNRMSNLVLACRTCNSLKGDMSTYAEAQKKAEIYMAFAEMLRDSGYIT